MRFFDVELPLTEERAHALYDILIEHAGAYTNPDHPHGRDAFVFATTEKRERSGGYEFRFIGALGFGGKIHVSSSRISVGLYRESETPERIAMRDATNEAIERLLDTWERERSS
jgi:hypothetical protein